MIKILFAGDFCPQKQTLELVERKEYSKLFYEFIDLFKVSDYSIINLECPVLKEDANPTLKTGVLLQTNSHSISCLKDVGVTMLTLANNHIYDWGDKGIKDTLDVCREYEIDVVGAGMNIAEAQKVLYKKIQGEDFAFVNFCENEFSIATEKKAGANPLNLPYNFKQIEEAKSKAKYVIVIVHGGNEHYQLPSPRIKDTYRFFIDIGANAVISHHTHCYSGFETYKDAPIFYSLGNFLFHSSYKEKDSFFEGLSIQLIFEDDKITYKEFPLIQSKNSSGVRLMNTKELLLYNYKIKELNNIISDDKLLKEKYAELVANNTKSYLSIFEPYNNRIFASLFHRKLLPSFVTKKKILRLLGYIRCETHRDILLEAFKQKLSTNK